MLTKLLSLLNSVHPLDAETESIINQYFEIIEVPRRHMLLKDGEICNYTYFMLSGLVRVFYIKDDEEVSAMFSEENDILNSPYSFYSRKPGYHFIETLQPSVLARISYKDLQQLYLRCPILNHIGRVITENYFVKSEERLYLIRNHTAEERYAYFLDNYPSLVQKLPLKYIASYLGITPETLSRTRSKIRR